MFQDRGDVAFDDRGHEGVVVGDAVIELAQAAQEDEGQFLFDVLPVREVESGAPHYLAGFASNEPRRELIDSRTCGVFD
jgi:hypothetical protein